MITKIRMIGGFSKIGIRDEWVWINTRTYVLNELWFIIPCLIILAAGILTGVYKGKKGEESGYLLSAISLIIFLECSYLTYIGLI